MNIIFAQFDFSHLNRKLGDQKERTLKKMRRFKNQRRAVDFCVQRKKQTD